MKRGRTVEAGVACLALAVLLTATAFALEEKNGRAPNLRGVGGAQVDPETLGGQLSKMEAAIRATPEGGP